jgi:hypothetical protein
MRSLLCGLIFNLPVIRSVSNSDLIWEADPTSLFADDLLFQDSDLPLDQWDQSFNQPVIALDQTGLSFNEPALPLDQIELLFDEPALPPDHTESLFDPVTSPEEFGFYTADSSMSLKDRETLVDDTSEHLSSENDIFGSLSDNDILAELAGCPASEYLPSLGISRIRRRDASHMCPAQLTSPPTDTDPGSKPQLDEAVRLRDLFWHTFLVMRFARFLAFSSAATPDENNFCLIYSAGLLKFGVCSSERLESDITETGDLSIPGLGRFTHFQVRHCSLSM